MACSPIVHYCSGGPCTCGCNQYCPCCGRTIRPKPVQWISWPYVKTVPVPVKPVYVQPTIPSFRLT